MTRPESERTDAPAPDEARQPTESLQATAAPPVALYVHVPFCVSHCPYCDFVVVAGREARGPANRIDAFVEALETELALRADALDARWGGPGARPPLASLYLGGGTPSLLPARPSARLIELVRARFGLAAGRGDHARGQPGTGRARRCGCAPRCRA